MVKHIMFPHSNAKMRTLTRSFNGAGYGTVLLDGGKGGQSSYFGLDNYLETVNRPTSSSGKGLADRISSRLSKLNIAPQTKTPRKNITLSI